MQTLPLTRALISVTDKNGIIEFGNALHQAGVELVSTGGTMRQLTQAGLPVRAVSEITGFPEILGGRVKTLHPAIHAGILADKDDPGHLRTLQEHNIAAFDLICVNLYDFGKAVAHNQDLRQAVEEIDIGGPTLLRAAAKNFHSICVVPHPDWYPRIRQEIQDRAGAVGLELRQQCAADTFAAVSRYDAMIADYLRPHME
ncbi:MAG: IMP cyclohydrolase [Thermodesulfobacteriota bacterium]